MAKNSNFYPVILAGGRGTRFWPLSRKKRAKQLLALDGKQTMIQQTVARLLPLASPKKFWIITNEDLRTAIAKQLPKLPKAQVLAEPAGRNTAPAIGLAAFLLLRENPEAVIGLFPSDHVIADEKRYRETLERGIEIAAAGANIVVLGIRPNRAETGYGYIEAGSAFQGDALRVRRFTEKPDAKKAAEFVAAGNYFWNSGMFLWSARTLADALREHLPKTASLLEEIAAAFGTRKFAATFRKLYPKCENISVDYAVLEPRSAKGEQAGQHFLPAGGFWLERSGLVDGAARAPHGQEQSAGRQSGGGFWHFSDECARQLHSCSGKVCGGGGRERSGGGGNPGCLADHDPAARAGCGQGCEVSRREEAAQTDVVQVGQ